MKYVLVYWVIGCMFVGFAEGDYHTKCPNDEIVVSEVIGLVAIYPVSFFSLFTDRAPRKSECKK